MLFAFALTAGSVVCFASGQASVMHDCGDGMQTAAACPFMSVSVPAIANITTAMKVLGFVTMLILIMGFIFGLLTGNNRVKKYLIFAYERKRDAVIGWCSDIVLNLISSGILHSRVFGF